MSIWAPPPLLSTTASKPKLCEYFWVRWSTGGVYEEFGFKGFVMISGRPSSGAGNCSGTVVITFRSACMQFELGLNGLWNHFATDTSRWADFLCKWFEQAICLRWVWMDFEATMQLVQVVLSDYCQVAVHRKLQKVTVSYNLFGLSLIGLWALMNEPSLVLNRPWRF